MGRRRTAIAAVCILLTGCANTVSNAESPAPTPSMIPRPLAERELSTLLLEPVQAAAAMRAPSLTITQTRTTMSDNSAVMAPPQCLAIDGAAEAAVYSDSGFRAEREVSLNDGDRFGYYVKQAVVLFGYQEKASDFVRSSARQWPACHSYTHTQSASQWTVGPIEATDNALSTLAVQQDAAAPGWGCGRALIAQNNVVVDVNTCSAAPGDSARVIARQIAANIAEAW